MTYTLPPSSLHFITDVYEFMQQDNQDTSRLGKQVAIYEDKLSSKVFNRKIERMQSTQSLSSFGKSEKISRKSLFIEENNYKIFEENGLVEYLTQVAPFKRLVEFDFNFVNFVHGGLVAFKKAIEEQKMTHIDEEEFKGSVISGKSSITNMECVRQQECMIIFEDYTKSGFLTYVALLFNEYHQNGNIQFILDCFDSSCSYDESNFPIGRFTHFIDKLHENVLISISTEKICAKLSDIIIARQKEVALKPSKSKVFFTYKSEDSSPILIKKYRSATSLNNDSLVKLQLTRTNKTSGFKKTCDFTELCRKEDFHQVFKKRN